MDSEDLLEAIEACPHDSFIIEDGTEVELDSTELDPLTEHIIELCPDLTTGELMAIYRNCFSSNINHCISECQYFIIFRGEAIIFDLYDSSSYY